MNIPLLPTSDRTAHVLSHSSILYLTTYRQGKMLPPPTKVSVLTLLLDKRMDFPWSLQVVGLCTFAPLHTMASKRSLTFGKHVGHLDMLGKLY